MRRSARLMAAVATAGALAAAALLQAPLSSADDLRAQVAAAQAELDEREKMASVATDAYNGAQIALQAAKDKLAAAQTRVDEAKAEADATREGIGRFAASAYRAGGLDYSLQVFLADDPQQFLDQATVLNILADNQSASLRRTQTAQLRLAQAEAELTQQQAAAQAAAEQAEAAKAEAARLYDEAQQYLAGLQEELRQQVLEERRQAAAEAARLAAEAAAQAQAAAEAAAREQEQSGGSSGGWDGNDWSGQTAGGDKAAIAVSAALAQLGEPYDPTGGGQPPDTWDCSKLTAWAWAQAGVQLTAYSFAQAAEVQQIDPNNLQPGDLLFYKYPWGGHVSMYIGGGQVVEASSPSTGVRVHPVYFGNFWMAGRPYA